MFKFYFNKITRHPSISVKQADKRYWHNIPVTHSKPKNDASLVINDPHPKAQKVSVAFARRFVRKDKCGVKGFKYRQYRMNRESELRIKRYLKEKYKKR